ncbi:MAG: hypothetical protein RLZZ281_807, partial [Pseudomonadota bacterium]
ALAHCIDRGTHPEPYVGGHLVVARARGVQSFYGIAHHVGEPLLDIEMHVFQGDRPLKGAGLDLRPNGIHTGLNIGKVF